MDKKWKKKNLFILNVTGQAQKKLPCVQRRLHARAQVHSTVTARHRGGPVRGGGTRECNDVAAAGEWKGK